MKNINKQLMIIAALLFGFQVNFAQCPNNNTQYGSSSAPTTVGAPTVLSYCMYGGEYRYVYNLIAGSQYAFETCGDSDFDTQITIYDAVTGAYVAYNDDYCGLQSRVTFTSNGNPVRVLIDRYYCGSQSSCMTLRATRLSGGAPAVNPCNSVSTLTCGSVGTFSLSGAGAWNGLGGPWSTPGEEQVFSFTPTLTGTHLIQIVHQGGYYVDFYYKTGGCSSSGWTYVDDVFSTSTAYGTLTAGVTYYFLIDDENTTASNGAIQVTCPTPVADPCNSVTDITSCGSSYNYSLASGAGAWNPPGPWGTPGNEDVFSYTPTTSGSHDITVTHSGGYYVDLFVKTGSCSSSGWTYVDDIFTSGTSSLSLTAGVTYYFLIDDENLTASSGTITVGCPCIPPPGGVDATVVVNGNTSYSSTTVGACDDCSLRSSKDRVLEVEITCAGTYTFSTCGGASWDTYLYLTTAPCGGSIITLNDDNCGLQSSMTANLNPGTYYVAVEGWSSFSQGSFTLSINKSCDLSVSLDPDVKNCGYNISCNEGNDGSIAAIDNGCGSTYAWSNGASSAVATDLFAGTYSVVVTDAYGCSASASATLTEPDALVVDAGEDEIVFYGYAPMSCAALNGSVTGGCQGYSYHWSNGDNTASSTVCPSVSTDYTLSVTDANGCIAEDVVTVCAVDVICYAGNSGNQKVEMCQIPPGNPANAHTICVSPNAVPAHLAIGCTLGACGEIDATCNSSALNKPDNNSEKTGINVFISENEVNLYPNPAINEVNLEFSVQIDETFVIEFYHILGKKLEQLPVENFIGGSRVIHNISSFERGNYFYRITIGETQITKSVNIER